MTKNGATKPRNMTPLMRRLTTLWQTRSAERFGGYEKPLTHKEFGQLAYVRKCLGERTCDVAAYALENWLRFASRAGSEAGVTFPTEPNIGFFVKHHGVAVNLMTPKKPKPLIVTPIPESPPQPTAPKEQPYHPTAEELAELIEGLKSEAEHTRSV